MCSLRVHPPSARRFERFRGRGMNSDAQKDLKVLNAAQGDLTMLWTIFVILVVLWLLGLVNYRTRQVASFIFCW